MESIREKSIEGYTVKVYQDEDPESPREWSNIGTMVCFHPDYRLGDKHNFTPESLQDFIKRPGILWLSLYLYDHSGISMSCGAPSLRKDNNHYWFDSGGWDTSLVGVIYIDFATIRKEMCRPLPMKKGQVNPDLRPINHIQVSDRRRALECLRDEVETYNRYLTGDVYGYVVESPEGENIDSCWGYYAEPAAVLAEGVAAARAHIEHTIGLYLDLAVAL